MSGNVAMETLMDCLESEKVGRRAGRGGGALALPEHSGGVVVQVVDSAFADVNEVGQHVVLCNSSGKFKVAVGDGAKGVAIGL